MGNEYSRRNSLNSYEDPVMPRLMNNQHPLKFHAIHGENVNLSKNCAVASRDEGFCKGIVFSQRPVSINEYVYIKFVDISNSWSGGLRIGFTSYDPVTYKNKLPKYACPGMTDVQGNWARALAERFVQKDSVLFYYCNQKGEVHYGLNEEERGIFFSGVNTSGKLWAMMDIYGNTIRIELLADVHFLKNPYHRQLNVLAPVGVPASSSRFVSAAREEECPLNFHQLHGREVSLHRSRVIAARSAASCGHGYVFTNQPVMVNDYVGIRVLICDIQNPVNVVIGLTSCDPSNLTLEDLPDYPEDLLDRPEYWVVNSVKDNCVRGDMFLFKICNDGAVKYSKNGNALSTVMFVDHTLNLWFFIDMNKSITQIQIEGPFSGVPDHDIVGHIETLRQYVDASLTSQEHNALNSLFPSQMPVEESRECVICCDAVSNSALYRCGHVCMCFNCAIQIKDSSNALCPICREEIQDVIKLYK